MEGLEWGIRAKMARYRKVRTINYHLKKVFGDSELVEDSVIRNFRITAANGKQYNTRHYNLAAIIAVGYKVNSEREVQFRKWATSIIEAFCCCHICPRRLAA